MRLRLRPNVKALVLVAGVLFLATVISAHTVPHEKRPSEFMDYEDGRSKIFLEENAPVVRGGRSKRRGVLGRREARNDEREVVYDDGRWKNRQGRHQIDPSSPRTTTPTNNNQKISQRTQMEVMRSSSSPEEYERRMRELLTTTDKEKFSIVDTTSSPLEPKEETSDPKENKLPEKVNPEEDNPLQSNSPHSPPLSAGVESKESIRSPIDRRCLSSADCVLPIVESTHVANDDAMEFCRPGSKQCVSDLVCQEVGFSSAPTKDDETNGDSGGIGVGAEDSSKHLNSAFPYHRGRSIKGDLVGACRRLPSFVLGRSRKRNLYRIAVQLTDLNNLLSPALRHVFAADDNNRAAPPTARVLSSGSLNVRVPDEDIGTLEFNISIAVNNRSGSRPSATNSDDGGGDLVHISDAHFSVDQQEVEKGSREGHNENLSGCDLATDTFHRFGGGNRGAAAPPSVESSSGRVRLWRERIHEVVNTFLRSPLAERGVHESSDDQKKNHSDNMFLLESFVDLQWQEVWSWLKTTLEMVQQRSQRGKTQEQTSSKNDNYQGRGRLFLHQYGVTDSPRSQEAEARRSSPSSTDLGGIIRSDFVTQFGPEVDFTVLTHLDERIINKDFLTSRADRVLKVHRQAKVDRSSVRLSPEFKGSVTFLIDLPDELFSPKDQRDNRRSEESGDEKETFNSRRRARRGMARRV